LHAKALIRWVPVGPLQSLAAVDHAAETQALSRPRLSCGGHFAARAAEAAAGGEVRARALGGEIDAIARTSTTCLRVLGREAVDIERNGLDCATDEGTEVAC